MKYNYKNIIAVLLMLGLCALYASSISGENKNEYISVNKKQYEEMQKALIQKSNDLNRMFILFDELKIPATNYYLIIKGKRKETIRDNKIEIDFGGIFTYTAELEIPQKNHYFFVDLSATKSDFNFESGVQFKPMENITIGAGLDFFKLLSRTNSIFIKARIEF